MAREKKAKTIKTTAKAAGTRSTGAQVADKSKPGPQEGKSARPIWTGNISFGLVNIPVKVASAIKEKGVHFHQLHEKDNSRVQYKIYCAKEGKEIPKDEIVKGYEVGKGQYVVVGDNELRALEPKATRGLEILNFVKIEEIDPLFYDRGYYLLPDKNSEKAYVVLLEAMKFSKMAGLARLVMRSKEYLAIVRPENNILSLETMHFADEVIRPQDMGFQPTTKPSDAEMKMAGQLIESMATSFDPEKVKDDYRHAVLDLVDKKAKGEKIVTSAEPEEGPQVIDLMAALQKSLHQAKKQAA